MKYNTKLTKAQMIDCLRAIQVSWGELADKYSNDPACDYCQVQAEAINAIIDLLDIKPQE